MDSLREQLIQARDSAAFAHNHLQAALAKADAVEAMLLYPMIGAIAKLEQDIKALLAANGEKP